MSDTIQIVILSRDRPDYLKKTIQSVLNQSLLTAKIKIIVSDNSEKSEVKKMIDRYYFDSNLKYIRREPPVLAIDHFRLVISECKEEYLVLFHDDDIMHPDYIETMLPFVQKNVAAVGCNSLVFKNDLEKATYKPHNFQAPKTFTSEKEFLEQYLPGSGWLAPFPGYMYNSEILKKIKLKRVTARGLYSDVLLLSSLLDYGKIIWIPNFLMYYRLHSSNESNNLYMSEVITMLNRMKHNGLGRSNVLVIMLRCGYWLKWILMQNIKDIFQWRNRTVFKFLFFSSFYLVSKASFWKAFFNRHTLRYFFKIKS